MSAEAPVEAPAPAGEGKIYAIYWKTDKDGKAITQMGIKADIAESDAPALENYDSKERKSIIDKFKAAVTTEAPKTGGLKKSTKRKGGNKRITRRRRRF
jgi:hypothetical protein